MAILLFQGEPVFSAKAGLRKLERLQRVFPQLITMTSRYLYVLDVEEGLDPQVVARMSLLLRVTEPLGAYEHTPEVLSVICTPTFSRPSTWAVNATRFLQDVQWAGLRKIERVAAYRFGVSESAPTLNSNPSLDKLFELLNTHESGDYCLTLNGLKAEFENRALLSFEDDEEANTPEGLEERDMQGVKLSASKILTAEWIVHDKHPYSIKARIENLEPYDNVIATCHDDAALVKACDIQALVVNAKTHVFEPINEPIALVSQSFQTKIDKYSTGCTSMDIGFGVKSIACVNGYRLSDATLETAQTVLPQLLAKRARYLSEMGVANLGGFVRLNSGVASAMEVQQYGVIRQYKTCLEAFDLEDACYVVLPLAEHRRVTQTLIGRCNMLDQSNPILKIEYTQEGSLLLALAEDRWDIFVYYAERECCPYERIAHREQALQLLKVSAEEGIQQVFAVEPMHPTPRIEKDLISSFQLADWDLFAAAKSVLAHPSVADKRYLIHHFDRTLSGLVARDQLVGQWQVPVSDVAVTLLGYDGAMGTAMAVGECSFQLTQAYPEVAMRLAFAEALTNLFAADVRDLKEIKLAIYWQMHESPQTDFIPKMMTGFVASVKEEFGIDTVSVSPMQNQNHSHQNPAQQTDLLAFTVHAHAPVMDVAATAIPRLKLYVGETELIYIDLSKFKGLAYSIFAECQAAQGIAKIPVEYPPEVDIAALSRLRPALISLRKRQWLLAYHDCSDGGLLTTLCEIAFASHCGLSIDLESDLGSLPEVLFSEAPGVVIQVRSDDVDEVLMLLSDYQLNANVIGAPNASDRMVIRYDDTVVIDCERLVFQKEWVNTSYELACMTGDPELAKSEFQLSLDPQDPGLFANLTFDPEKNNMAPFIHHVKPKAAVLKSSCSTGYSELVAALYQAGFECVEVRSSDLRAGHLDLSQFQFLAVGSGYAYGDALGAGWAWAQSLLNHPKLRKTFQQFFERPQTLTLGLGNGAQLLSYLTDIIPHATSWPTFSVNQSEAYESRLSMVEVLESKSLLTSNMIGSKLPIVTASHAGRAEFKRPSSVEDSLHQGQVLCRYLDHHGKPSQDYPSNPTGAEGGVCGFTSFDGRVTGMIVHPERCFLSVQMSWRPSEWGRYSPWMQLFRNARVALG